MLFVDQVMKEVKPVELSKINNVFFALWSTKIVMIIAWSRTVVLHPRTGYLCYNFQDSIRIVLAVFGIMLWMKGMLLVNLQGYYIK